MNSFSQQVNKNSSQKKDLKMSPLVALLVVLLAANVSQEANVLDVKCSRQFVVIAGLRHKFLSIPQGISRFIAGSAIKESEDSKLRMYFLR
jgi:hypothetical protein